MFQLNGKEFGNLKYQFGTSDQKVILDNDLAKIYGVATSRLNEQVKRNIERFPEDFAFQLSWMNTT